MFARKPSTAEQAKIDAQAKLEAELSEAIAGLRSELAKLESERKARAEERKLSGELEGLQKQIAKLTIDKDRIVEDNAREKREVTHMVGLERKRQEFEAEQAKQSVATARTEAMLEVREENLAAERTAFEQHMKFQNDRFEAEVGYLKDLMGQILDRLPTVTVDRQLSDRTVTRKAPPAE